jgi:hypothetical protein
MSRKLREIAMRHVPKGVEVRWNKRTFKRDHFYIFAQHSYGRTYICHPEILCAGDLYTFLHECAHIHLGHLKTNFSSYLHEYDAYRWAERIMKRNGIPVPKSAMRQGKKYLLECILSEKPLTVQRYLKEVL